MAATTITIAIEKGGAGKTITAQNIAYLMGDEGKKVLCIDTDPQGNLTSSLSGGEEISSPLFRGKGLYNLIDGFKSDAQTRKYIIESNYENVDLIPCNSQTPRINKRIVEIYDDVQLESEDEKKKAVPQECYLEYFLNQVKDEYDYIIIDTQPTRDALLLTNALAAADYVLIPTLAEAYSETSAFRTYAICNGLKDSGKYHIRGAGVFLNNVDKKAAATKEVLEQCQAALGNSLYGTVVPASRTVNSSVNKNLPVCYMAKTQPVAKAYVSIYEELKQRLAKLEG